MSCPGKNVRVGFARVGILQCTGKCFVHFFLHYPYNSGIGNIQVKVFRVEVRVGVVRMEDVRVGIFLDGNFRIEVVWAGIVRVVIMCVKVVLVGNGHVEVAQVEVFWVAIFQIKGVWMGDIQMGVVRVGVIGVV